jgi:hypothetical protein
VAVVLLFLGAPAVQAEGLGVPNAKFGVGGPEPHAAAWIFADNGPLGYRVDARNPVHLQIDLFVRENPTLPLEVGKRYQLTVANYTAYPLEVIAKGASVAQDQVLLSMGSEVGAFASDPEVNWQDLGQGAVQFTLTEGLYHAMIDAGGTPGYRCRTHAQTMRGEFAVQANPLLVQRTAFRPMGMN